MGLGGAVAEAARGVAEKQVEGTLWGVGRPVKRGEEVAGAEAVGVGEGKAVAEMLPGAEAEELEDC